MSGTIYDQYGGPAGAAAIADAFCDLASRNRIVRHLFRETNMRKLSEQQAQFLTGVMGGPSGAGDERLRAVHQPMRITDPEYDVVTALYKEAMILAKMHHSDVDAVMRKIDAKRPLIVARTML